MSLVHCILLFARFSWDACVACAGPEAGKTCEAGWPYRGLYITPRVPTRAFFGTTPKPRSVLPILRYMGLDTNQTPLGAPAHPRASRSVLLGLRESEGHARVARFQGESPVDPLVLIAASPARPALVLFVDLQHARPKLGVCSLYGPSVFNTTHATASAPYHESALLQDLADLRNSAFVDAFEKVEIVRLTITAALGVDALDALRVVGEGRGACAGLARLLDLRQLAYGILLVGL